MSGIFIRFRVRQFLAHRTSRLTLLACVLGMGLPTSSWAVSKLTGCYRITRLITNVDSAFYTDPGTITSNWTGASDTAGQGAYPMTVTINTPPFVPDGTLLGSATSPIYNLGANGVGTYSPEMVLFRCSPEAATANGLYEYYATNGDNEHAGKWDASADSGIPGTYYTYYKGLISRITNLATGRYSSRYWAARQLTGLDKDSQGWLLVKARNFSQYKLEFFQCSTCTAHYSSTSANPGYWSHTRPVGYVAFVAPNFGGSVQVGADSSTAFSGFPFRWPGAIAPYHTVYIRRTATCAVTNVTPVVSFPLITVSELNQGLTRQLPVTIQMRCQSATPSGMTAFSSGTAANQTALGILAQPANAQAAVKAGLKTTGSAVTWLLSDNYGTDPTVATGVGVALTRPGGGALNFLTNQYVTMGGAKDGWDPVLNDATSIGSPGVGLTSYSRSIIATFKAFAPGTVPVTPGRYNATAQVIVRVQ
ncbi:MAG TPA: fimbrial protein [Paraburkholderia sp.]|uniref:fimbrial protein n=1 Tax=Paraburkholderia sp. TaxID=1926495 RepID=UPI002C87D678|nr:fimbrial protein [Paraburkholderia sp.]HTR09074.1 fimbrial protein [Paraburkholderia sp.]